MQGDFYQNGGIYTLAQQEALEKRVEQEKQLQSEQIKKDLYDEQAIVKNASKGILGVDVDDYSVFGEKMDANMQSLGQLLARTGANFVLPGSSAVMMGASVLGPQAEKALNEGATFDEAAMSGVISAAGEMLSEQISGPIKIKGLELDAAASKTIARTISNKVGRTLARLGVDMASEGGEEIFSSVISAVGEKLTYAEDKDWEELLTKEDLVDSFLGGAILGLVGGGAKAVSSAVHGVDYASGLTENEQKVVDTLYKERVEEANKKGGKVDKAKIYDSVVSDMDKGYISTEDIERVLGGNSDSVASMVQNDRLMESYNERTRRGQAFEADLTQYDETQQKVIQKAIDSKILNNSNRTHDFVDMISKISADKGVLFDFTNNAKLKESGFAIDGKEVNGYVTKVGVTVNIDSRKALNTTVGHEITHVLEGTEFYNEMQKAVFAYAKSKGELGKRWSALKELYKDIEGTDVNAELTADLVGDYLFTDEEFIRNLSTGNRNVFEKIYDEIKYLCKVVTARSKEAKELERVKKLFAEAYRESSNAQKNTADDSGVEYSVSETTDGRSVAVVDNDILSNIDTRKWDKETKNHAKKAANEALKQFHNGFEINGVEYIDNKKTRDEYTRSNYSEALSRKNPDAYMDKMRAASVIDDVVRVATDWSSDGQLKHDRSDFVDFVRGNTLIKSGDSTYSAVVLAGINNNGKAVFYDVVDIVPDSFEMKESELSSAVATDKPPNAIPESSDGANVAENNPDVKREVSENFEKSSVQNSLSEADEHPVHYGNYNVYGSDAGIAPVAENVTADKMEDIAPVTKDSSVISKTETTPSDTVRTTFESAEDLNAYIKDNYNFDALSAEDKHSIQMFAKRKQEEAVLADLEARLAEEGDKAAETGDLTEFNRLLHDLDEIKESIRDKSRFKLPPPNKTTKDLNHLAPFRKSEKTQTVTASDNVSVDTDAALAEGERKALEAAKSGLEARMLKAVESSETDNFKEFNRLTAMWNDLDARIKALPKPVQKTEESKPLTKAEKIRKRLLNDAVSFDKLFDTDTDENRVKFEAIHKATEQAQKLISEGTEGVRPIAQIFGNISVDGKLEDFESYLHHQLNIDRTILNERGFGENKPVFDTEEVKVSTEESRQEVKRLEEENPEFKKAAEDVYAFFKNLNKTLVDSGVITQETADRWAEMYPHYVGISRARWGEQVSDSLLKFLNENSSDASEIENIDKFFEDIDKAHTSYGITSSGTDFLPLMDTMVDRALRTYWTVALKQPGAVDSQIAPEPTIPVTADSDIAPVLVAPVAEDTATNTETVTEMQTEQEQTEVEDLADSKEAVNERFMKNHFFFKEVLDEYMIDTGRIFEKISNKLKDDTLRSKWHYIRNAHAMAQHFIGNGSETHGVKALTDIVKGVKESGASADFCDYLKHYRNIDGMTLRSRYGVAANHNYMKDFSAGKSYQEVKRLEAEHPEFKQLAQDCWDYAAYWRNQLVEHKLISQEDAETWAEMYKHYVPIRNGANVLETMAQYTAEMQKAISMNNFSTELAGILHSQNGSDFIGIDDFISKVDAGRNLFEFGKNGKRHTYTAYVNGKKTTFDITREMYMALKPAGKILNAKIPVLSHISDFRRKTITEYNPWFVMSNAVKDPQDIVFNSKHPKETYAEFLSGNAYREIMHKGEWYQEYVANGGEACTYFDTKKLSFDPNKGVGEYLKDKTGLNRLSAVGNFIETAPRLAEYIASREAGRTVEQSMLDAAEVTTNFQAGGKLAKFMNRNGCTFLNASIQGAVQQFRNIGDAKRAGIKGWAGLAAKFLVAGVAPNILNHLVWGDDEEYEELPDYVKNNYYIPFKYGDGQFVRLPKGRTAAVLQDCIEQVVRQSIGDDAADWETFGDLVIENLAPNNPVTDNIFAPIIQVAKNEAWYGDDIVPYRLQDLPSAEQYDEKTDDLSIWLGEQWDVSPKKMNYLLDQYSGVIGDTLLPYFTPKAESPTDSKFLQAFAPFRDRFTTDSVLNNRVTGDFYETLEAAEAQAESEDASMEDKLKSDILISYNVEISKLYAEQRKIQTSDMKDSEKYKRNREIKEEINALQEQGLAALDDYRYDGIYAEAGDKRYNYDAEDDTWWEIKPKLSDGEDNWYYQQEQAVTKDLGISYDEYWNNKEMYDDFYYVASGYDKDSEADDTIETARAVFGYERFAEYASVLATLKADKDKYGNSIRGTKKRKIQQYVNSLDIPDIEKKILMKMQYPNNHGNDYQIIKYIDENDDISYNEMIKIFKELGYKMDKNGYVTWW